MPAIDLSILNQRQTPAFYADVFANRPAAGFVGRIFVSTDTFAFYRDNGTGWDLIGGPGTGTITGSGASGQIALWSGASTIVGDTGLTYNGTDNSLTASKFIVTGGTSSQFLKGDGSLDSNTYNTGSGAASQVAFFSGTNAISGENNLWWDSANNHLGINTNTPATALDVNHNGTLVAKFNNTTTTSTLLAFENAGNEQWWIGTENTNNDFLFYDATNFPTLSLRTTFKTNGQVLIGGGSTGSGRLVVESAVSDNGIQIVGANAPSLRIDSAATGPTKRIGLGISTATNNFIQGSADRDMCIFNGSTTASPMLFGIYDTTNVQEAARISAARNFLIGTTTDNGSKLQVSGTATFSGNINGTTSLFGSDFLSNETSKVGIAFESGYGKINSWGANTSTFGGLKLQISASNGQTVNALTIEPTGAATFINDVYIGGATSSSGLVGASKLIVNREIGIQNGNATGPYIRQIVGSANQNITFETSAFTGADPRLIFKVGGSNRLNIVPTTGNILIGTDTDAGQKLQVDGNAAISSNLNLGFSGSGPTINTAGGLATVLNMNGGLIFNYQSSVPSPYTQNIVIDIVFGNWGSNPVIALVDLMATLREYAATSGIAYGKIFATSPSTSTFSTFDVSNITTSQSSVSASSGGSYTLRITINPTNNTDVFGIYMNIQTGGIGTAVSSITISYV